MAGRTPNSGRSGAVGFDDELFLAHYGVKGMKWGVIRDNAKAAGRAIEKIGLSSDAKRAKSVKSKIKVAGVDSLTNEDLRVVIQRMNLEVQYTQLKKAQFADSYLGIGKKFVGKFLKGAFAAGAAAGANQAAGSAGSYSWGAPVTPRAISR